jgi:hypothetical protein
MFTYSHVHAYSRVHYQAIAKPKPQAFLFMSSAHFLRILYLHLPAEQQVCATMRKISRKERFIGVFTA